LNKFTELHVQLDDFVRWYLATKIALMTRSLTLSLTIVFALTAVGFGHAALPTWDHIVIVIDENKSHTQVVGNPVDAPYINNTLKAGGAVLSDMYAITHPSQPNYIHLFSGDNQGVFYSFDTSEITPFHTPNLAAELVAAGRTFTGYSENLPAVGYTGYETEFGLYSRRHNPWVHWQDDDAPAFNHLPPNMNQPFSAFPSTPDMFDTLPSVSIVIPNNNNNMHNLPILRGDMWIESNLGAYAEWAKDNNSLLIVTFDEDEYNLRNKIPTVFYGAHVVAGAEVGGTWTLHNLLHTIEAANGTAHAGASNDVRPIVGAFATDVEAGTATFRQGVNGYAGTTDTVINSANPDAAHGLAPGVVLVADDASRTQGLIRFDNLFGHGAGQVPLGATILSAKLSIVTGLYGDEHSYNEVSLHQLSVPFNQDSTWNSLGSGVTVGAEGFATPEFSLFPNSRGDYAIFDVSDSITSFAAAAALGENVNHGWLINPSGTDPWLYYSSEAGVDDRPILSITYAVARPLITLFGDYDQDGTVDAADYVVWRDALGQSIVLPNDSTPGTVTQADYEVWCTHFGEIAVSEPGTKVSAAIPEPNTFVLLIVAVVGVACCSARLHIVI
jgi:acid phosphatase